MQVNITEFLKETHIEEQFYPGKKLVKPYPQPGEFKSHSVVLDWRVPERIRIDLRAGAKGIDLPADRLKNYPVSFQTPTYVEIEVAGNDDDEDEGEAKGKSSGGGGGKKPKKKKSLNAFSRATEGKIPETGKITEMVVMGMKVAAEAFATVFDTLKEQMKHAKVGPTELLAKAGNFVTRYTPPSFMQPKGDETAVYKYDRIKNETMFGRPAPG